MTINGSPIEFTQTEILTASVFLQVRASEMLSLSTRIFLISDRELSLVLHHQPRQYNNGYFYFNECVYITSNHLYEVIKKKLLIISYLLYNDDVPSIENILRSFDYFAETISSINSRISETENRLTEYFARLASFTGYKKWDMVAFIKAARKYKAVAELVDNKISLTFKNVKCGNETEGYIQYKSIQVFLGQQNKRPIRFI